MLFSQKNRPGHGEERQSKYCRIHNQRIIQLGNCLTCNSIASVCEAKGCIKNHQQNERIHSVLTIEYIREVVRKFLHSDQNKKALLKKMIADYFTAARKQLQILYEQIYQAVDHFKFDNIVFSEHENSIIEKLLEEDFNSIDCSEVAIIIPKLIKYTNVEDGHFLHLRQYLQNEKDKVPKLLDGIILNLPYFRDSILKRKQNEFVEISSEWLREVNQKLKQISFRPKKLRIKYIDDEGEQQESKYENIQKQFVRNICTLQILTGIQEFQLYCVWNVKEEDFQVAFFQALVRYPFLKRVTVYTGYKITDTQFVDAVVNESSVEAKVTKKEWAF